MKFILQIVSLTFFFSKMGMNAVVDFKKPDNKLPENPKSKPSLGSIIQSLGGGQGSNTSTPPKK